jgi:pilus assembly protein Flp/PilA
MHQPPLADGRHEERGATATEYGLLVSLVAAAIIAGVAAFGTGVENLYDRSCNDVATVAGNTGC